LLLIDTTKLSWWVSNDTYTISNVITDSQGINYETYILENLEKWRR